MSEIKNAELTSFGIDIRDGKLSFESGYGDKAPDPSKREIKPELDERILASAEGMAQIYITPDAISITNQSNGIHVSQYGTILDGKVHIGREPSDIRIALYWVLNNELLTTLPSTTYTPISVLKYSEPPCIKWVQTLAKFGYKI